MASKPWYVNVPELDPLHARHLDNMRRSQEEETAINPKVLMLKLLSPASVAMYSCTTHLGQWGRYFYRIVRASLSLLNHEKLAVLDLNYHHSDGPCATKVAELYREVCQLLSPAIMFPITADQCERIMAAEQCLTERVVAGRWELGTIPLEEWEFLIPEPPTLAGDFIGQPMTSGAVTLLHSEWKKAARIVVVGDSSVGYYMGNNAIASYQLRQPIQAQYHKSSDVVHCHGASLRGLYEQVRLLHGALRNLSLIHI